MPRKKREYIDEPHQVAQEYYDILEKAEKLSAQQVEKSLRKLILKDAEFLDSYSLLHEILDDAERFDEAEKILDRAFGKALEMILDKNGQWPDSLEWGWHENRHIIRALLKKAVGLWMKYENVLALDLLKKLLKTNPNDNIGARNYILAIRMGMDFDDFEDRFREGMGYGMKLVKWFDKNHPKYPDDFSEWVEWQNAMLS